MASAPHSFHEMLLQSRVEANQTVDTMAVLLNMSPDDYERLERGKNPDDETLRRLCKLTGWNYYDAQRLIINEMISPNPKAPAAQPGQAAPLPIMQSPSSPLTPTPAPLQQQPPKSGARSHETLGNRLREARTSLGQSKDILSMLLKIPLEEYERLEAGESPSDEVLRRISMVYNWNYLDLVDLARAEQAHVFQPRLPSPPFAGSTAHLNRFNKISNDMTALFPKLSPPDQQSVLAQLELVRDTMRRHQVVTHAEPAQVPQAQ